MKAKEVKKILNITQPTLSKYVKIGLISCVKINPYHFEYSEDDVYKIIGLKKERKNKINISYSRVSTQKQKNDLKSQSQRIYEFCVSKGLDLDVQLEDIKSGMDFNNRSGFNTLIKMIIQGEIEIIIIENKDRLVRFGFDFVCNLCKFYGTKILVINDNLNNKSYEEEMIEDLTSIIHHFIAKSYSNRRKLNKLKTDLMSGIKYFHL